MFLTSWLFPVCDLRKSPPDSQMMMHEEDPGGQLSSVSGICLQVFTASQLGDMYCLHTPQYWLQNYKRSGGNAHWMLNPDQNSGLDTVALERI